METFLIQFLGTEDLMSFTIAYLWALIGLALSLWYGIEKRNKSSKATPVVFSFSFFLRDNALRIFANLLILFAIVVFYQERMGEPITPFGALGVGLAFDQIAAKFKGVDKKARA